MLKTSKEPIFIDGVRCLKMPLISFYIKVSPLLRKHFLFNFIKDITQEEIRTYHFPDGTKKLSFGHRTEELVPIFWIMNDIKRYLMELSILECEIYMYLAFERYALNSDKKEDYNIIIQSM